MNLQKLYTQREGHRRFIERYLEKIEHAKENESLLQFNAILKTIEEKLQVLEPLNDKILAQTDADGTAEETYLTDEYTMEMEIKLCHLRAFRDQQKSVYSTTRRDDQGITGHNEEQSNNNGLNPTANSFHPERTVSTFSHSSSAINSSQFYRLPKMSLPTFSGDILQWQSFWDSYESTIHTNVNLTDVQKFTYLKSQLEGNAARVLEGFAMTNANYARAIDLLRERFGKQHKITHAAMQALLKLPAPSSKLSSLRNYYDKMETYIRSLEAVGQCQEHYGNLLVPVILDKMPSEIRRQLARENGENNWVLDDLRHAINREICILESGTAQNEPEVDDNEATASFLTGAKSKKRAQQDRKISGVSPFNFKCAFCDGGHKSSECKAFTDTESRLKVVKEKRLCFNCLGKHPVAKCNSNKRCRNCKRKHHTTICSSRQGGDHATGGNQATGSSTNEASSPETAVLHSYTSPPYKGVLLKTAIATVSSSKHIQSEANILFDEGAQKSFITQQLAEELELTSEGTETLYLSSFGSRSNKVQQVDVAIVHLITDNRQKIPIRVRIVPTISTPINNTLQNTVSELPYLRGLKLAHPVNGDFTFNISLLIGADFFWDIVEDQVIRGNGPTAVKSKIGYLLSGPIHTQIPRDKDHVFNIMASHSPGHTDRESIAEQDRRLFIKKVGNGSSGTHVSSNSTNLEPLKQPHVFFGRKMTSPPYHDHCTDDIALLRSDQTFRYRAKTQTKNINKSKKRWKYFSAKREDHNTTKSSEEHFRVEDVVAKVKMKHGHSDRKTTGNY